MNHASNVTDAEKSNFAGVLDYLNIALKTVTNLIFSKKSEGESSQINSRNIQHTNQMPPLVPKSLRNLKSVLPEIKEEFDDMLEDDIPQINDEDWPTDLNKVPTNHSYFANDDQFEIEP